MNRSLHWNWNNYVRSCENFYWILTTVVMVVPAVEKAVHLANLDFAIKVSTLWLDGRIATTSEGWNSYLSEFIFCGSSHLSEEVFPWRNAKWIFLWGEESGRRFVRIYFTSFTQKSDILWATSWGVIENGNNLGCRIWLDAWQSRQKQK